MKGNCDSSVDIKASDFPICDGVSLIYVDDLNIYITHGNEYSFEKDWKINRKGILIYGYEHVPYIKRKNDMLFFTIFLKMVHIIIALGKELIINYYGEIKKELINNETYKKIKDYSKNKNDLKTYYSIGKLLSEAGKHYGESIIEKYLIRLTYELGKRYNKSSLKRMR